MVFLSPFRQMPVWYLNLDYFLCLPHPCPIWKDGSVPCMKENQSYHNKKKDTNHLSIIKKRTFYFPQ